MRWRGAATQLPARDVQPVGSVVPWPAERVDGHDVATAAMAAGAAGVLAGRAVDAAAVLAPRADAHRAGPGSGAYALAADTDGVGAAVLAALAALARSVVHTLSQSGLRVVALTGSSGKTS